MFCPQCQGEYPPHVHRCCDCDVLRVERLAVKHGHSPVMLLATLLVMVALGDNPFEAQIASVIGCTSVVFPLVFCDVGPGHAIRGKGTKGFSLGEKAVRKKLPLLVCIDAGSRVVLFAGVTGAARLPPTGGLAGISILNIST
jgi:hypothetical protein